MSYRDVINMFGPHNASWIDQYVRSRIPDQLLENERILKIVQNTLLRTFGLTAGSPIGTLISFELSERLSQDALDSTHNITEDATVNAAAATAEDATAADPVMNEFEKCLTFSGLLNNRKCKTHNFIHMTVRDPSLLLPWRQVEPDVYAVPKKEIEQAISKAAQIKFITQPYRFRNQLCTFISLKNLYDYFARRNNLEHLVPLLHILALVSSRTCTPIPTSRHGLKQVGLDFLSRSSFENVLANLETGAVDQQSVPSDKRVSSMFLSQKIPVGTNYFDLLLPTTITNQ